VTPAITRSGRWTHTLRCAFGDAIDYPNYPAFAPDGRLFVSDSGKFAEANGGIVVIEADGTRLGRPPELWLSPTASPLMKRRSGLSNRPPRGQCDVARRHRTRTRDRVERCVPDGLALDAAGGLLISCYQPNQLWRWTEDNGLELIFDEWSRRTNLSPTNVAFCGENLERLHSASLCGHDIVTMRPHTLVHQFDFHDRTNG